MISLYTELTKDLDKTDKKRSELANKIRSAVETRLKFIKEYRTLLSETQQLNGFLKYKKVCKRK